MCTGPEAILDRIVEALRRGFFHCQILQGGWVEQGLRSGHCSKKVAPGSCERNCGWCRAWGMAREHEVGRRRVQSPLSRNLAVKRNKARGKALEGEVRKRECFYLFVFRRQWTEIRFTLRENIL